MAGYDDEMLMTRSLNVTPKTKEQHLIARSDKFVAYVCKAIKGGDRRFVLLKLTTDRHETSRGSLRQQSYLLILYTDDIQDVSARTVGGKVDLLAPRRWSSDRSDPPHWLWACLQDKFVLEF